MKKLTNDIGPQIISELKAAFPELPSKGIVAGGAICDWFLGIPPNDVDVFVPSTGFEKKLTGVNTATFGVPDLDSYESISCIAWKKTYQVVSSQRQGMINIITCESDFLSPSVLISGFDFNATKVAIDLENGQIIYDESFVQFLKDRKLKLTAMFTPAHSAIRYFNKKHHLQATGDDDLEMEILTAAWDMSRVGDLTYDLPYRFGDMYMNKALDAMELGLENYFDLIPAENFWTLWPKTTSKFKTDNLEHVMLPVFGPQALRSQRIEIPDSYIQKIALVKSATDNPAIHKMLDLFNGSYVRGKLTERSVMIVSAFLNRRPHLQPIILGSSIERQVQIIKRLARFARKYGSWVYGLAQTRAVPLDLMNDDAFDQLAAKHVDYFSKEQSPRFAISNPPRNFLWYKIEQITTPRDLYECAEKLRLSTVDHEKVFVPGRFVFMVTSRIKKSDSALVTVARVSFLDSLVLSYRVRPTTVISRGLHSACIWLSSFGGSPDRIKQLSKFWKTSTNMVRNLLWHEGFGRSNKSTFSVS